MLTGHDGSAGQATGKPIPLPISTASHFRVYRANGAKLWHFRYTWVGQRSRALVQLSRAVAA